MIKKGNLIQVEIESVAYKGKGLCKVDGMVLFVACTLPGDQVEVRIIKKKKSYAEGIVVKRIKDSEKRVPLACTHAEYCGGCTWQHASIEAQRVFKTRQVKEAVAHTAGINPSIVRDIIPCDQDLGYRNKMEYSFGPRKWLTPDEISSGAEFSKDGVYAGLHAPGRFDKIMDLSECHLQPPPSFELLNTIRSWMIEHGVSAYDPIDHRGFMRHLVVRNSPKTRQWMVNLITNGEDNDLYTSLTTHLLQTYPTISTLLFTVNDTRSPVSYGKKEIILHGDGKILEELGNLKFWIRPQTFFQTNTLQAEKLFSTARDFILNDHSEFNRERARLLDLYCGVGSITLTMHDLFSHCTGVELIEESVVYARENAQLNHISNCTFVSGDSSKILKPDFLTEHAFPGGIRPEDVLITDPPRSGMHPEVIQQICNSGIHKIIYISCDPITMARDLGLLKDTYDVHVIQPVDMFPQTYHIENVSCLTLKSN